MKRSNDPSLCPSRAYVSSEGYKSNAHEIMDCRLSDDWPTYILYNTVVSLIRKLESRKSKRLDGEVM